MFLMHYEHWETEAICLNDSRSRDVGDAIPYIFIYGRTLVNLATCLNASRSRDVGDAIPYMVGVFRKDAIPYIFIYG